MKVNAKGTSEREADSGGSLFSPALQRDDIRGVLPLPASPRSACAGPAVLQSTARNFDPDSSRARQEKRRDGDFVWRFDQTLPTRRLLTFGAVYSAVPHLLRFCRPRRSSCLTSAPCLPTCSPVLRDCHRILEHDERDDRSQLTVFSSHRKKHRHTHIRSQVSLSVSSFSRSFLRSFCFPDVTTDCSLISLLRLFRIVTELL